MGRYRREASEERYGLVAAGVNDGLWDWNLTTGEVLYSARWFSLLGYDRQEAVAGVDAWLERVHVDDRARVQTRLDNHLAGATDWRLSAPSFLWQPPWTWNWSL